MLGAAGAPGSAPGGQSEASPHLTLTDRRPHNAAWSVAAIFVITQRILGAFYTVISLFLVHY